MLKQAFDLIVSGFVKKDNGRAIFFLFLRRGKEKFALTGDECQKSCKLIMKSLDNG